MTTGFELAIERHIAAPPERVFQVWTARLAEWWAPRPWRTKIIEQEWRPGGRSALRMTGPEGAVSEMEGVVLEFIPNRSIVFTNAFTAGWVPQKPFMVGLFSFAPEGVGTRYRAAARLWDAETQAQHEAMGFHRGWTHVAEQLAALAEGR
ncbi:SRPBCC domain-containing protein [Roseococcus sp. SDR]|uniref:SRPBCC domain-containing protein n=1 Tax=Roseococcus sp. SDR TaxID=2835532 RepID=UPI001BCFA1C1|nr:SRPBCC domain-containing protein [Roseococcus sp. SDR]MBS7792709.1 SRPBCC domain-containing protein [Roseococcus sp. SDR]MBV1848023.1 SRPBCC domain-containing protein [Roseococcus sp. SDR]